MKWSLLRAPAWIAVLASIGTLWSAIASAQTAPPPPSAPASSSGSYSVSYDPYPVPAAWAFLEEKTGVSGSWDQQQDIEWDGVISYSGKAPGYYFYRVAGYYMYGDFMFYNIYSSEVAVAVGVAPPSQVDPVEVQKTYQYIVRAGDSNGDGSADQLYVQRTSGSGAGALDKFILAVLADGSFSVITPSPGQAAGAQGWPQVNVPIGLEDINFDGFVDMVIGQVASVIAGGLDQIVYAPGNVYSTTPLGTRKIDSSFKKFAREFQSWIARPTFFEDTAPVGLIPLFGIIPECYFYLDPDGYWKYDCYYTWGIVGWTTGPDLSGFAQQAVQIKQIFDASGTSPLSAQAASDTKSTLEGAFGISMPMGIDVPWPSADPAVENRWLGRILARLTLILQVTSFLASDTPNIPFFHYTPDWAIPLILSAGSVNSGTGTVFITLDDYVSAAVAKQRLALPTVPAGRFVLESRNMRDIAYLGIVQPKYGEPGGGREWITSGPVPIGVPPRFIRLGP